MYLFIYLDTLILRVENFVEDVLCISPPGMKRNNKKYIFLQAAVYLTFRQCCIFSFLWFGLGAITRRIIHDSRFQ